MKLFFDTSALVKFFHEETGTDGVTSWINNPDNEIWVLDLARLEFASALYRRFRNKGISESDIDTALASFIEQVSSFNIEPLGQSVVDEAESLMSNFGKTKGLRTLDALHLAAYLLISEEDWTFVSTDKNLCDTARAAGCSVLNPLENH